MIQNIYPLMDTLTLFDKLALALREIRQGTRIGAGRRRSRQQEILVD